MSRPNHGPWRFDEFPLDAEPVDGQPMSCAQVAAALGVSKQLVSKIEQDALYKIRKALGIDEPGKRRQWKR